MTSTAHYKGSHGSGSEAFAAKLVIFRPILAVKKAKRLCVEEAVRAVLSDDDEEQNNSDYGSESDFETESEGEMHSNNDCDDIIDTDSAESDQLIPDPVPEQAPRRQGHDNMHWAHDTTGFVDGNFRPNEQLGPKNLPDNLNPDSTPVEYLSLFWDDVLWELLVTETNRNAQYVKEAKPNSYYAKSFQPVTVDEMKGFFGCRIAMECLLYKDRYEQYWRNKDNPLTVTPGIPEIVPRDRFLAIWSLLHCVDERDQGLDKNDKIYKSRPIFTYLIRKFKRYYVPNLDEGIIPTKNSLSIK